MTVVQDRKEIGRAPFAAAFRRDGFGVVRGAVDAREAVTLRTALHELLAGVPPQSSPDPLEIHVPHLVEKHPGFAALATAPPLLSTLAGLFDSMPQLVASYGHVKPAHTSAHTGVHSDIAHLQGVPHHESMLMVKVMYALTPVGPESGATFIYPGTHRLPAPQQVRRTDEDGVHILLAAGDAQLFHANLLHTATANASGNPRLSVWFVYAQPWMRAFPGHEFSGAFLDALRPQLRAEPALAAVFGLSNPYSTRR